MISTTTKKLRFQLHQAKLTSGWFQQQRQEQTTNIFKQPHRSKMRLTWRNLDNYRSYNNLTFPLQTNSILYKRIIIRSVKTGEKVERSNIRYSNLMYWKHWDPHEIKSVTSIWNWHDGICTWQIKTWKLVIFLKLSYNIIDVVTDSIMLRFNL